MSIRTAPGKDNLAVTGFLGAVAAVSTLIGGIGIIFGFKPARRAARLNPIVVLRHE